jgi:hypothetical protein
MSVDLICGPVWDDRRLQGARKVSGSGLASSPPWGICFRPGSSPKPAVLARAMASSSATCLQRNTHR